MKYCAVVFVFVAVAATAIVYAAPKPDDEKYTTKYDHIDVQKILDNDRLFNSYYECFEGTGKCTAEGEEFKKHFHEALETCCAHCSRAQIDGVGLVFTHLKEKKPEKMEELKAKYDPTGEKEKECKAKYEKEKI